MAYFKINNVQISGVSAAVPKAVESNWDYDILSETEKKLLIKTTGVEEKRRAPKGMTTSDLCFAAATKLIADLDWNATDIDILIFVSQSSDYYLPATAIILQDKLGLNKSSIAFDVGLGCSGFVYGLSVISSMMSAAGLKKGLLMVGDISSATCSSLDKSTYPLFGDAGTVTALEVNANAPTISFDLFSDGSGFESIIIPHGGARNLISKESFDMKELSPGITRSNLNLALDGLEVFNFSLREVPKAVKEFMIKNIQSVEDYDYFVMHQANKLMNESIRKKVGFPVEKTPYTLSKFGNTSSASIPLTIVSQLKNNISNNSKNILITGFGVGLSWGVCSLPLSNVICPDIIEI